MKSERENIVFDLGSAIHKLKELSEQKPRKFIESVDIAINTNIDAKQSNQVVRGSLVLPAGSGKKVRVAVFTEDEQAQKEALKNGAVEAGLNELIAKIDNGFLGFDYCIATPNAMKLLSKIAKKLGPRGLMPNPKNGNITNDVITVLKEALNGRINFKNDKYGIIHACCGKINFEEKDLFNNIKAIIDTVKGLKPEGIKGKFIKNAYLSCTMGSSVAIDVENI